MKAKLFAMFSANLFHLGLGSIGTGVELRNNYACGIFGACHLIGWDFLYPSSVEQLLWRIASISYVVFPFLLMFLLFLTTVADDDVDFWPPECSVKYLNNMSLFITFFLYFLARVYLLVAIFISLRSVPSGVYQTVNWSLYFPHF